MSRSSTVTLAFLILFANMNLKMAFHNLKQKRHIANPNQAFWNELKSLEQHMCAGFCKCDTKCGASA